MKKLEINEREYETIEEAFTKEQLKEISETINDIRLRDRVIKDRLRKILVEDGDFEEIGCGTNRIVFAKKNKKISTVYKIGFNNRGVKDNVMEKSLFDTDLGKDVNVAVECLDMYSMGYILNQERVDKVMDSKDMEKHIDTVRKICEWYSRGFTVFDLGPKSIRNWGLRIDEDGEEYPMPIDYAYLKPLNGKELKCRMCEADLIYDEDYTVLVCPECGEVFRITSF